MVLIRNILLIIIVMFILCGCEDRKCLKSHEEDSMCTSYMYYHSNNSMKMIPIIRPCKETVCDKYEDE